MLRISILSSITLGLLAANVARADARDEDGYYQGKLAKQSITMEIGPDTSGTPAQYRYLRYGPSIAMDVADAAKGGVDLTEELRSGSAGGRFHGQLDDNGNLSGTWTSADHNKWIAFNFKRIADLSQYAVREPKFTVEYSVPQFTAKTPFYRAVNDLLTHQLKEDMNSTVADYRKSIQDADGDRLPWQNKTNVEVLHADDAMVSLLYTTDEYTGGAHGNYGYTAKTYVWQDGELVELAASDLVSPKSISKVTDMLIAELARRHASSAEDARTIKLDDEVINPTANGLMFTFAPYQVGSFAEGSYTVILPYSKLDGMIPSDSPVNRLVTKQVATTAMP
jgi:hypothetical protein